MNEAAKYLQPSVVAQLANMELRARMVVEGFITGLHKSPYHGFSVEFTEHRPYMPGDEIKHIDWKAYGKTDRYFIKQFEEETNLKSYLILDASASMNYASNGNLKKIQYASYVGAALAYLTSARTRTGMSARPARSTRHTERAEESVEASVDVSSRSARRTQRRNKLYCGIREKAAAWRTCLIVYTGIQM